MPNINLNLLLIFYKLRHSQCEMMTFGCNFEFSIIKLTFELTLYIYKDVQYFFPQSRIIIKKNNVESMINVQYINVYKGRMHYSRMLFQSNRYKIWRRFFATSIIRKCAYYCRYHDKYKNAQNDVCCSE